ncbi:MAG: hypothetical protein ACE5IO_08685, partial [Thermoplasmata archaeon]
FLSTNLIHSIGTWTSSWRPLGRAAGTSREVKSGVYVGSGAVTHVVRVGLETDLRDAIFGRNAPEEYNASWK